MHCNLFRLATITLSLQFSVVSAQVFNSGPDDPGLFDAVINLPADTNLGNSESIGGVPGQTTQLNVMDGGSVGGTFNAFLGSEVNITGGNVGNNFDASAGSEVNISGGSVGDFFTVNVGSVVNISGGTVGSNIASLGSEVNISGGSVGAGFDVFSGSVVNISDGNVGNNFGAELGSEVNISGGNVGDFFRADVGSVVNISGGTVGIFFANLGSEVNLLGTNFSLDGVLLENLVMGEAFTILQRNVTLAGQLADGTPFDFVMNLSFVPGEDIFSTEAALTVTLVAEGDFDLDGDVDGTDYLQWQRGETLEPLSETDLAVWQSNFNGGSPAVTTSIPEPVTLGLLGFAVVLLTTPRHRMLTA